MQINVGRTACNHAGSNAIIQVLSHHGGVVLCRASIIADRSAEGNIAPARTKRKRTDAVEISDPHRASDVDGRAAGGDVTGQITDTGARFNKAAVGRDGYTRCGVEVSTHHKITARVDGEQTAHGDVTVEHDIARCRQRQVMGGCGNVGQYTDYSALCATRAGTDHDISGRHCGR